MIDYVTEIIKIEKRQYVCDICGIKSKRTAMPAKHIPTGWVEVGLLRHYCPMCASKINEGRRVEAATK